MAKQKTIPFDEAMQAISTPKQWAGGIRFEWKSPSVRRFPAPYSFRAALKLGNRIAEGWFVELYFKQSRIHGVRDTLSIALIVNGARVFAIDDNGPSSHMNKIGIEEPFYQANADHPHLHRPVKDGSYGYAEPLTSSTAQAFWELFLSKANIAGAPRLELPEQGQMGLL